MRLPNTAHTSRPWRIRKLSRAFRLEDVWALPTPGGPDDFPRLVQGIAGGASDTVFAHRTVGPRRQRPGNLNRGGSSAVTRHGGLGLLELPAVTQRQVIRIDSGQKR